MPQARQLKKIPYDFLTKTGETTLDQVPYEYLDEVVAGHLPDLVDLNIGIAWHKDLKPDRDGKVLLGRCMLQGDLHRQMTGIDVIVLLNHTWWMDPRVEEKQRKALLHHELCHVGIMKDDNGDAVKDERSKIRLYPRKHNIEEFDEVIKDWGIWKDDLARTAQAMLAADAAVSADESALVPAVV